MSDKIWGGRFSKDLDPGMMHFNASLAFDKMLYAYDIAGSQVHAKMLAR
jgi:argininosuccinate lyase